MTNTYARNTGYLLIALAAALLVNLVFQTMTLSGPWDFSADKAKETLDSIHTHRTTFMLSIASDMVANLITIIIATRIVFLFRSRSEQLSAAAGRYLGLGPVIMLVDDALACALVFTVRGGVDNDVTQQVATALGALWVSVTPLAFIVIDFGAVAVGLILLRTLAVPGSPNPPKWLGYVAFLMFLMPIAALLSFASIGFAPLGLLGAIFVLLFVIGNGISFIRSGVHA